MIDTTNLTDTAQCEKLLVLLQEYLHHNHAYILMIKSQLLQSYSQTKPKTRPVMDRQMQLAMDVLQVRMFRIGGCPTAVFLFRS